MQVSGYKELLQNLLPEHIIIGTYTVMLNPEYDDCGYEMELKSKYTNKMIMTNQDSQTELAAFIRKFFEVDIKRSASEELWYCCGFLSNAVERINKRR